MLKGPRCCQATIQVPAPGSPSARSAPRARDLHATHCSLAQTPRHHSHRGVQHQHRSLPGPRRCSRLSSDIKRHDVSANVALLAKRVLSATVQLVPCLCQSANPSSRSLASHRGTQARPCVTGGPWHAAKVPRELCQAGPRGVQAAG